MKTVFWTCILALVCLFSFVACDGSGGGSGDAGSAPNPPQVTGINPAANDSSVNLGNSIAATFDKGMNVGSAGTFVVYGNKTGKLTGLYTGGKSQTLIFNPDFAFKISEVLEIILTGALTATDGASLAPPFVYRFRAEALAGTGVFTAGDTISGMTGARGLAAGDWDDDGDSDLAVANFSNSRVAILKNNGSGGFGASSSVGSQSGASALVALDFDGDGDLDLAVANRGGSTVGLLRNGGNGNFSSAGAVIGQFDATGLAAGDWDGDGDIDLAVANFGGDEVAILENDGTGSFVDVESTIGLSGATALASGDWDGDDALDLAVANSGIDNVKTLKNVPF